MIICLYYKNFLIDNLFISSACSTEPKRQVNVKCVTDVTRIKCQLIIAKNSIINFQSLI